MPSGNAIYTYTGPNASEYVQGQIFLKDQPKHITDQGVIAVCATREDFSSSKPMTGFLATLSDEQREHALDYRGEDFIAPAKPIEVAVCFGSHPRPHPRTAKPKKAKSK